MSVRSTVPRMPRAFDVAASRLARNPRKMSWLAWLTEALEIGGEPRLEPRPAEGKPRGAGAASVAADGGPCFPSLVVGGTVDDVHDAHERRRAVHHGRRTAQDLYVVEVLEAQRRQGR